MSGAMVDCAFCGAHVRWSDSWPLEDSPDRVCKGCIPDDIAEEMTDESPGDIVWTQGAAMCNSCLHPWRAVVEEVAGVPMIGGLECPACGAMAGAWIKPRNQFPKEVIE